MAAQKLMIKRTDDRYNDDTGGYDTAPGSPEENKKIVGEFLRSAIEEAGFTTKKKYVDGEDYYDSKIRVYIKDLGGKCYMEASYDFDALGGDVDSDDEIQVKEFYLGTDEYDYEIDEFYKSRSEIVKKLAKDLNKTVGTAKKFTKNDATKAAS